MSKKDGWFVGVDLGAGKDLSAAVTMARRPDGTVEVIDSRTFPGTGLGVKAAEALSAALANTAASMQEVAEAIGKMGGAAGVTADAAASAISSIMQRRDMKVGQIGCYDVDCKTCNSTGFNFDASIDTFCKVCNGTGRIASDPAQRTNAVLSAICDFELRNKGYEMTDCEACVLNNADKHPCGDCDGIGFHKHSGPVRHKMNLLPAHDIRYGTDTQADEAEYLTAAGINVVLIDLDVEQMVLLCDFEMDGVTSFKANVFWVGLVRMLIHDKYMENVSVPEGGRVPVQRIWSHDQIVRMLKEINENEDLYNFLLDLREVELSRHGNAEKSAAVACAARWMRTLRKQRDTWSTGKTAIGDPGVRNIRAMPTGFKKPDYKPGKKYRRKRY